MCEPPLIIWLQSQLIYTNGSDYHQNNSQGVKHIDFVSLGNGNQADPQGKWLSGQVGSTCYKEVAVLFQGLAVFPNNVVQTQVQFIKCQGLLCVGCGFSCGIIVCFL